MSRRGEDEICNGGWVNKVRFLDLKGKGVGVDW